MRVAIHLFGLAALLCAQTATVWKWYGYGENNHPFPNLCTPFSNNGNGRIGVVRVLGDTVYVMGTYTRIAPSASPLPLPRVSTDPTTPSATTPNNAGISTYLAAYDRQTGHIRWWMSFRCDLYNFDGFVEGQDFVVRPDGRIYLLLHTNVDTAFRWDYQAASGSSNSGIFDISSFFTSIPLTNRVSSILEISPGSPPSVQVRKAIGLSDVDGEVHLKYLYYIRDTLYATGDYIVQAPGAWALSDFLGSSLFCYATPSCSNTSGSNEWRGLIIGYQTAGNWTLIRAAEVRYESGIMYEPVKGHRLAKDPVGGLLRWVIEVEQNGSKSLIYNTNPGGASTASITPGPLSTPVTTLYAISLNPDLSLPPVPNYHQLAQRTTASLAPEPVFVETRGDSILWVRSANYDLAIMNGPSSWYTLTSLPYVAVVRQRLPNTDNYALTLSHQGLTGLSTFPLSPVISDIAVERGWDLLYLMGHAYGATGPVNDLLGLPAARTSGFLLGLRYQGGSYGLLGGTSFISHRTSDPTTRNVLVAGGAYDSLRAQFYLFGTGEDSVWIRRKWPDGSNDTVRICTVGGGASGLWLGRLDWYRIMTPGNYTHCAPDSITSTPVAIPVTGKNVHSSDVPVGTPAGWRFGWVPAQTPWKSTAAPLDLVGPIMGNQEGQYAYGLHLLTKGAYHPGDYYLVGTVYPVLRHQWVDIIDTLKLTVPGTTIPPARRTTSTATTFMVAPYAGRLEASAPYISGPYPRYRNENWKFNFINALYYHPYYYYPPAYQGQEMLFVITHTSPHQIWGINLRTGMVDSMPVADPNQAHRYFMDPVRGTYWAHEIPGSPTSTMRIRRAPFTSTSEALIHQGTNCVNTVGTAYPLRYPERWLRDIHRAAVLPNGDFVFIADACPNARYSLWRVSLATDSVYRVTGFTTLGSTCPQDGTGNTAVIGYFPFTNLAVWGDTIFWIENAFSSSCLSQSGNRLLIRKAYPYGSIKTYKVETLDTILYSGSVAEYLLFSPLPSPGLIFGTYGSSSEAMIRYDLSTRSRDTLIRCLTGSSLCCQYGLSDWITGLTHTAALLRGGAIVTERNGSVKIAVPIALSGSGDTLITGGPIGSVSSTGGTPVAPTHTGGSNFEFAWPAAGGPGLDSTYLGVTLSSCGNGKAFYYPFYHLPKFRVWLKAPDTVCLGQVFHSYVGRDTEVVESNCRVSHRLFKNATSAQGYLTWITGGNESNRWRATQAGYDTIKTVLESAKWHYLVSDSALSFPVRIRQGHRLRLSVALEGPYEATTFLHRRHPFLTRYNLGAYTQRILGISSDSLWRLPYPPGDSLMKNWNSLVLVEPTGTCPNAGAWYCDTIWTTLARVELRVSPTGPVVDSAYALVDSAGRLTAYAAPAGGSTSGHADTLHFCHCDPTTPKYITVRFPHHLPLHTPAISLPVRGLGQADSLDLRDPTYLEGIPGEHYTFVPGPGGTVRAAAWAGNCADLHNAFIPGGAHVDAGWINAADYDFVITRNGITSGFSVADLNSDGLVNALDAVIVISNQNALRQSSRP